MSKHSTDKIPFYRNAKILPALTQAAVLLAIVAGGLLLLWNVKRGMEAQDLDTSFRFLGRPAGFRISEGFPFSPEDSYLKAFGVGLYNTFRATVFGILLATVLGVIAGTARLSSNWLVNRIAFTYIEIIRNTPLLVQLVFWYFAVVLQLPNVRDAITIGPIFFSQRGLAIPALRAPILFWGTCLLGLIASFLIWLWVKRRSVEGERTRLALWLVAANLALFGLIAYLIFRTSLSISLPELGTFRVTGGSTLSPEFTALLAALIFYFGAFIAEVIRGGIMAVPKGQWEAGQALGLHYLEVLRIIILPQALRIIIPPLGNVYLNLTKASSLAVAIGFPDLFGLSVTIGSQSGYSVQVMLMVLASYLLLTLTVAGLMILLNRNVQVKTR